MCRWLAYTGSPILLSKALYAPAHSLIDQSLHARLGAEATNGDGFGVGWYDDLSPVPGTFRSIEPAWNDRNLHELADHVSSGHFFAHVRAAIGSPVQQTNCHPFRHERWLWMHNGFLAEFASLKRDLVLAVDPDLYPMIEGGTDSEILFYLALSFGLTDDPPAAIARAVGLVESVGQAHGVANPFQGTLATADSERMWVFRYSSAGQSRSLFYTADVPTLRRLYPDRQILQEFSADARLVVSEPIGDLPGAWREMPEGSYAVIAGGRDELLPFVPTSPSRAPATA
jgi:glutamine amidotransferase